MKKDAGQIIGLYRRNAQVWADLRGSAMPERRWLQKFMDLLPNASSVLDLGCGSGRPIAQHLSKNGVNVIGVDASPELIEIARKTLPDAQLVVADMRHLRLGARFDGIVAWNSTFHLTPEDQRRMFPIFARHAKKGAALIFTSGPRHGDAIGVFEGEPLYHASLDPEEYRSLLDQNGFDLIDYVLEDPDCGYHSVWLARST